MLEKGKFVLRESTVDLICKLVRQKVDRRNELVKTARARAHAKSPKEVLLAWERQMVQKIDVEGVARFSNFWFEMARVVVVGLDLKIRAFVQDAFPASLKISSRQFSVAIHGNLGGRRIERERCGFACALRVDIALKGETVA